MKLRLTKRCAKWINFHVLVRDLCEGNNETRDAITAAIQSGMDVSPNHDITRQL